MIIKKSGVYMILNLKTEKRYYGSSINITKRFQRHKDDLRHGKHKNKELLSDWEKYGEDSFSFIIIEHTEENLGEKERTLIQGGKEVYNIQIPNDNGHQTFCPESVKEKLKNCERVSSGKPIICTNGDITVEYPSIAEAARQLGLVANKICDVLYGFKNVPRNLKKGRVVYRRAVRHHKGWVFKYK